MPREKGFWDKFGTVIKVGLGVVFIVTTTLAAEHYFAPREVVRQVVTDHNRDILKLQQVVGMTQKEFNLFQIDGQIERNRAQLRQILIEEESSDCSPKMRTLFRKQKDSINEELESLQRKRDMVEQKGD